MDRQARPSAPRVSRLSRSLSRAALQACSVAWSVYTPGCMPLTQNPLALHTWTLDTTPLPALLEVARVTGWDAVELRRLDFDRAEAAGTSEAAVLELVRKSGLDVSAVGVTSGWMFADGAERQRLVTAFERSCAAAAALGCPIVMSAVDKETGDISRAVASVR